MGKGNEAETATTQGIYHLGGYRCHGCSGGSHVDAHACVGTGQKPGSADEMR